MAARGVILGLLRQEAGEQVRRQVGDMEPGVRAH